MKFILKLIFNLYSVLILECVVYHREDAMTSQDSIQEPVIEVPIIKQTVPFDSFISVYCEVS